MRRFHDDPLNDIDGDGVGDSSDRCLGFDDTLDADSDGFPDGCDPCPLDPMDDSDGDGVCDGSDLCLGNDFSASSICNNIDDDDDGDGCLDGVDAQPTLTSADPITMDWAMIVTFVSVLIPVAIMIPMGPAITSMQTMTTMAAQMRKIRHHGLLTDPDEDGVATDCDICLSPIPMTAITMASANLKIYVRGPMHRAIPMAMACAIGR